MSDLRFVRAFDNAIDDDDDDDAADAIDPDDPCLCEDDRELRVVVASSTTVSSTEVSMTLFLEVDLPTCDDTVGPFFASGFVILAFDAAAAAAAAAALAFTAFADFFTTASFSAAVDDFFSFFFAGASSESSDPSSP